MNSNSTQSWGENPTIIIEYVDYEEEHPLEPLELQGTPVDFTGETYHDFHSTRFPHDVNRNLPPLKTIPCPVITPEVDAYVTPLSLCHPEGSNRFSEKVVIPECVETTSSSILETSFTSVDIDSNHLTPNGSWISDSSYQGCFDIKSGMECVTQVLTGIPTSASSICKHQTPENPYLDDAFHMAQDKKRLFSSSMIGIFCLTISIIGLIAVGIAIYVEFVTNSPSSMNPRNDGLNETYMCDLLMENCVPMSSVIDSFHLKNSSIGTMEPFPKSNRLQTMFGSSYMNPVNIKLHNGI